jgi:glycosyltransferase involved in cell wall biosynthesis
MFFEGGLRTEGKRKKSRKGHPLVSVVTVVFNTHETIERTIESVVGQSYDNVEYIVVDGGSDDGTLDTIKQYANKIDYFVSQPDNGIYDAMNKGISLSSGDIVGIINSDDWYERDTVETIARTYEEDDGCIQYGICRYFDDEGEIIVQTPLASRLERQMIAHPTCFVPKRLYTMHGDFDTDYKIAADYDLMLRMYKKGVPFRLHHKLLSNCTVGGACHSNPHTSFREIAMIKHRHSVITRRQMRKLLLKNELKRPVNSVVEMLKRVYFR